MSEEIVAILRRYCAGEVSLEATRLALNVASAQDVFDMVHERGMDDSKAIMKEMQMIAPIWRALRALRS